MKRATIVLFMLMLKALAFAQTANYDASLIPKELMPYASAVIRNEEVNIEVKDLDNTVYHTKKAITVLNKNGDDIARIVIWYNKRNPVKSIKGTVYNEFGKPMGKFTERDFADVNSGADYSLFEDSRVKHFIPTIGSYPYTIEYEIEQLSKQSLNFDDWRPNPEENLAVEKSTFTFACAPSFNIRYKEINLPVKAVIGTNKEGQKTYTWAVANMKAVRDEPYSPNPENYLATVKIAPEKFRYEGISGSFTNWNELGRWNYEKLLAGRGVLPPETVERVKELTAGIADPKLKAKKLYEYMQGRTRYISVQVGIGGYQPFLASDVDRTSYGDCKALVNYTQALFKAADIDSWYCVVQSGSRKVSLMSDFATMGQGNHVILCLPFKNDTTFLECTSQKIPFGYLSDFTDDRTVLACTPQGGKLMHTATYTPQTNLQQRKADFIIDKDGSLTGDIKTIYNGTQYDSMEELIDEPAAEQLKALQKLYNNISNLDIEKHTLKVDKTRLPSITENINLFARDFASADNGKLYFSLNPLNRMGRAPRDVRNRSTQVYINRGYTDEDEIVFELPKGYHADNIPLDISLEKPFGKFSAKMTIKGDKLTFKRRMQLLDGTYSKETYRDLVDFYKEVVDADAYNVTLVKD